MKRILITAILLASTVTANGAEMALHNKGGGNIVLTSVPCGADSSQNVVYAYDKHGDVIGGCWTVDKDAMTVIVRYANGMYHVYRAADFHKIGGRDE